MIIQARELLYVENMRQVCLLDLTADFGVKTNTKFIVFGKGEQNWYSELSVNSTPESNFCVYSKVIYDPGIFSNIQLL